MAQGHSDAMDRVAVTELADIAERFGLADIYVFGSRAAEFVSADPGSDRSSRPEPRADLDIGVRPHRDRHLGARERAELTVALEDLFGAPRVDLVILPEAPPYLALEVISGELLYCADDVEQAEYELYVLRRAGDLAPFERERRAHILNRS